MPNNGDTHGSALAIGGVCVFFRSAAHRVFLLCTQEDLTVSPSLTAGSGSGLFAAGAAHVLQVCCNCCTSLPAGSGSWSSSGESQTSPPFVHEEEISRLNVNTIIRRRTDPPASSGALPPLSQAGRPLARPVSMATGRQRKDPVGCHAMKKRRCRPAVSGRESHSDEAWRASAGFTWWDIEEKTVHRSCHFFVEVEHDLSSNHFYQNARNWFEYIIEDMVKCPARY